MEPQPSTSCYEPPSFGAARFEHARVLTPEQRAEQKVREAENLKAYTFPVTGKDPRQKHRLSQFFNTAMIDKDYMVVGSHVDEATYQRIKQGEFIDFGKLIPKDRIISEEENRLELVIKGGQSYYVPISETTEINSFSKWEQAFRVYSNIYTKFYPHHLSELIEYNHVIHTISQMYPWDSVYMYDKDFHIHMAKHPERNWSIILQQAWSLRLRENKVNSSSTPYKQGNNGNSGKNSSVDEPCHRYNKRRCPFGSGCCFDHRCSYCFKMGHMIWNCCKLAADIERERARSRYQNNNSHRREGSPKENKKFNPELQ